MELPFNTVYSKSLIDGQSKVPVANWDTKRAWHEYAFEQLAAAGYEISSAYTMVKKNKNVKFVYRDAVWHGIDMMGTGVASFGHISGTHIQNVAGWNEYFDALNAGKLPLSRAFPTTAKERLTREMILQLKMGKIKPAYFARKYDADILKIFGSQYEMLRHEGMLDFTRDEVTLTSQGFLRVDQLLPTFYDQKYRNGRYT
jgi:oxygen-independent coproporphyrinogen-3 oxidase